ncbi:MAG TPA: 30S ribosomal protein S16 [Patescibacteria group bacterium]|nr:30S ribosomal protein S16 [Patescibacteria group bacterium]
MAVVIRLSRTGKKGERKFRIIVKERRSRRDGQPVEVLGWFEKGKDGGKKQINLDRYNYWVSQGALPSPTVAELVK